MKKVILLILIFPVFYSHAQQLKVTLSDGTFFTTDTTQIGDLILKGSTLISYVPNTQRKRRLIKLYGTKYGTDIFYGTIRMGMTKQMVKEVLGEPTDINRTVSTYSTHEQWVYEKDGAKTEYYYFDDGRLTGWQD